MQPDKKKLKRCSNYDISGIALVSMDSLVCTVPYVIADNAVIKFYIF